jgi:hypothetical protein
VAVELISSIKNRYRELLEAYRFRTGRFVTPGGKSVLICAEGTPSACISEFIDRFQQDYPRENIFSLSRAAVPGPLSEQALIPYPLRFPGSNRYLRRLRTTLVLVDSGVTPPTHFLKRALDNGVLVAFVDPAAASRDQATFLAKSDAADNIVYDLGRQGVSLLLELVHAKLSTEEEFRDKLKSRIKFWLWKNFVFASRAKDLRKLGGFNEIREALGNPGSILCLGNGPSSEDLQLSRKDYDSLFRVNHRWLERGLFTDPDLVFTGASESVVKVGRDIVYGFLNEDKAFPIIRKVSKTVGKLGFFGAVELGFPIDEFTPYKPTNGLLMVFAAVNLKPDRLIIAGIDLYQDPRGCYPDESATPNHYTSLHEAPRELDLMLRLLASYDGDLEIVGNKLALEYERYITTKS